MIYGLPGSGLSASGNQLWTQEDSQLPTDPAQNDQFGAAMVVADFNGDGYDDLAIGIPHEDFPEYPDPERDLGGAVQVVYGSGAGLSPTRAQIWGQDSPGMLDETEINVGQRERLVRNGAVTAISAHVRRRQPSAHQGAQLLESITAWSRSRPRCRRSRSRRRRARSRCRS